MTKKELIEAVAQSTGLSKRQVTAVIDEAVSTIKTTVNNGGEVIIRQFGTFKQTHRNKKVARNMSTGEKIIVPAKNAPSFKPSKAF